MKKIAFIAVVILTVLGAAVFTVGLSNRNGKK